MNIDMVLLILAFVAFLLAAVKESASGINWIAVGLALWVLTLIIP